jgi:hypothetical protein
MPQYGTIRYDTATYDSAPDTRDPITTRIDGRGEVQNEVEYILAVIKQEWPGATFPRHLVRINRDEPFIIETGERTQAVNLDNVAAVGVSLASRSRELFGTSPQYRVETVLDVRIEAKPEPEKGQIADSASFKTLVASVQAAINSRLKYPDVPSDDPLGRIEYLDLQIENDDDQEQDYKNYYRFDFSIRMRGNQELP